METTAVNIFQSGLKAVGRVEEEEQHDVSISEFHVVGVFSVLDVGRLNCERRDSVPALFLDCFDLSCEKQNKANKNNKRWRAKHLNFECFYVSLVVCQTSEKQEESFGSLR